MLNIRRYTLERRSLLPKPAIETTADSLVTAAEEALHIGKTPLMEDLCRIRSIPGSHTPEFVLDHL